MRQFSIFIVVQIAGVALCAAIAWPYLGQESVPLPTEGPRLAASRADTSALETPLGVPASLFDSAANAQLDTIVELSANGFARKSSWRELGATLVLADDLDTRDRKIAAGYRLRPGTLDLELEDGTQRKLDVYFGLQAEAATHALRWFRNRIDRNPIDARWNFVTNSLMGDVAGQQLAVEENLDRVAAALANGDQKVELVVRPVPARATSAALADFDPKERLSSFDTQFNTRKRGRATNLRLAAGAIDGTVLMPGDLFSYNQVVGERSEGRGFQDAPVIVQGEIVEGVGGGACQVSSTLHAASLFGGLEVVERANHSLPSNYIEKGLDAVVAWPMLDLKLRNTYDHPVVLRIYLDEDQIRAQVFGPEKGRRVVVRREIIEEIPFNELVTTDPATPPETFRIKRRGTVGFRVLRARLMWNDDKEEFERLPVDIYQSRSQHVVIGPETVYPPIEDELDAPETLQDE